MLDIFHGLRLVVKRRTISIDNAIFRCHWFFTSTLLVSFSVIITARQYVGQPIECHSMNKIPNSLLNSYCWVQSTFTVPQACNQQIGLDVPYPCIDNTRGREIKIYAYYQWVGMVLFVQGLMFHLPYYLWKVWENGLISAITSGLRVVVLSDLERAKKREIVVEYMYQHLGCHKRYAYKYFLCEFICLLNLAGQIWAVNRFFDGQFLSYGLDVLHYSARSSSPQTTNNFQNNQQRNNPSHASHQYPANSQQAIPASNNNNNNNLLTHLIANDNNSIQQQAQQQQQQQQQQQHLSYADLKMQNLINLHRANNRQISPIDPMSLVFPRITKCTYYDFGSSGDVQKHDAICLLPLNIINEKIYIALWFWFFLLAILTFVVVVFRIFAIISPTVRCRGLQSRCKLANEKHVKFIIEFCDVGDWFLFYMVAENVDPIVMREIVSSLADKLHQFYEIKKGLCNDTNHDHSLIKPEILTGLTGQATTLISGSDLSRAESECDFNTNCPNPIQNSTDSTIRPEDCRYSQNNDSPEIIMQSNHHRPQSRLMSTNNHLGYNEHEPRQWRSNTHEPPDHHHQQQQQQQFLNANNHNNNHLNDSILIDSDQHQQQAHTSGLGMGLSHRASSRTVAQANECLPLPRGNRNAFKTKRLYSKRLWSMELGPGDFRRQMLFGERSANREPPETIFAGSSTNILDTSPLTGTTTATPANSRQQQQAPQPPPTFRLQISAPPDSQMNGLEATPPSASHRHQEEPPAAYHRQYDQYDQHHNQVNRNGITNRLRSPLLSPLSRSHSGHTESNNSRDEACRSACDSFVMEMQQAYRRRISPSPSMQNYHLQSQNQLYHQQPQQQQTASSFHQSISSMCDIMDLERHRRF